MSIVAALNGMPRDADAPSETSHDASNDGSTSEPHDDFITPEVFESLASTYEHSSQGIKIWLLSFGHFSPGTNVSLRFKIGEADLPTSPPYSILPTLTKWLRSWFQGSLTDAHDRSNLSWLLHFSANYLRLGHSQLDYDEIRELCQVCLFICENARQHSHLEGCLSVFLSIAQGECFPPQCLKQTLKILSSATVILEKPLSRISDCVKILAQGSLHDATLDAVYSQLRSVAPQSEDSKVPSEQDVTSHLTVARGATRLLKELLETNLDNEKWTLDLSETLGVLQEASDGKLLRLSTEIVSFLTKLLQSQRSQEVLQSEHMLSTVLDIFSNCREANVIPEINDTALTKTKSPKEDAQSRERRYKRDHALANRLFLEAVANALPLISEGSTGRVWQTIREDLDNLSAEPRANAITFVTKNKICLPSYNKNWAIELFMLIDKVVLGKQTLTDKQVEDSLRMHDEPSGKFVQDLAQQRVQQRMTILELCFQAVRSSVSLGEECDTELDATTLPAAEVGQKALRVLLQVLQSEQDAQVLDVFFRELSELVVTSGAQEFPYSSIIISTLEREILLKNAGSTGNHLVIIAATKCLRDIFLRALALDAGLVNSTYGVLLRIANCKECKSQQCRIYAMSVLFGIRCDTSGTIYIDTSDDSAYIASALCKTEESLNAMFADVESESTSGSGRFHTAMEKQLWMYPDEGILARLWTVPDVSKAHVKGSESLEANNDLDLSDWLLVVLTNLQEDKDWETYSYALVHLASQLTNTKLFEGSMKILASLRGFMTGRVRERKLMFDPPRDFGLDKSDVALCFYHILTRMIPYYKLQPPNPHASEARKGIELVRAFRAGISGDLYIGTARSCIHALAICCYETPEAVGSEYPGIIEAMIKTVSTPHILVHILEFLAQVARLPSLHRYFMEEEVRGIFGICIAALKALMSKEEGKHTPASLSDAKRASGFSNTSGHTRGNVQTPFRAAMLKEKGLKQYSCALAYHTMIFWFLSIPIGHRHKYVKEVTRQLIWSDTRGNTTIDEQTIVLIDLMQRTAFSDLPETARDESFSGDDYETTSFIDGNSVVTIETHRTNGRSQITKRQAAGTTHAVYEPQIQPLRPHHDRSFYNELERRGFSDQVTPSHTFLNMVGSAVPLELPEQPLKLNPNEAYVARALRSIDLKSTVDSHKIAVTLLKDGQIHEKEYLANTTGTKSFDGFLQNIGTRVSLQPPCPFTPFGLLYEIDGTETVAWRDRINEVVFEISTLMPNVEEDEYQARKKSHMGNCLVLVVFNQSNKMWAWNNFASQATLVNIVITPANRVPHSEASDEFEHEYYQVEVLTKEEYQNISAAAETKVVSRQTLAPFVRMLALNANIFSECARNESTGDNEFPSSWRYRMQEIIQLRERTQQRVLDNEDTLAKRYDFTRWT